MKITLTGASGFIGGPLVESLLASGHELTLLGRKNPGGGKGRFFKWDSERDAVPVGALDGADAVIHMAGEPVSQRWNETVKRKIIDSRLNGTNHLVTALASCSKRPRVLVSGSAIGYYGSRGDAVLDEKSAPGAGFLPEVCVDWEVAAAKAAGLGVRTCLMRTGIVLHHSGGALKQMIPPYKMFVGGPLGDGRPWMSWIHREDLVRMIVWAMETEAAEGPLNGVSPTPCTGEEFAKGLGRALARPALFKVPEFAIRLLFGEMSQIILASQRVLPSEVERLGFVYKFPHLDAALKAAVD